MYFMKDTFSEKIGYPSWVEKIFYLGLIFLSFAIFLKHTKGLLWFSYFLFCFILICIIKKHKAFYFKSSLLIFWLILWLLCLFWFVLVSPYKEASFEAFLLNYFFHVILFLIFAFFAYNLPSDKQKNIWLFLSFPAILSIFYYYFYVYYKCNFDTLCMLKSSFTFIKDSFLSGVVVPSASFVMLSIVTFFLGLENRRKFRILFLIISGFLLLFLIYFGRRAALLGITLSFLIAGFLVSERYIKKIILVLLAMVSVLLSLFILTPFGQEIMFKSRDKIELLLSINKEDWAKAGSMGYRLYIWPIYLKKSLEEPFSGTGLGRRVQKRVLSETNKKALSLEHAHNIFLNIALQAGWHTALLFLIFYLVILRKAYGLIKGPNSRPYYTGLFIFLIAFFIMSLFEGMEEGVRFTPFWIVSGLIWGFNLKEREKALLENR